MLETRRDFFRTLGGGILFLLVVEDEADAQESGVRRRGAVELPQNIGAWLHIGEDGGVTVYTGKTEVGQNIRTSLSQAVAEELRVPVASVRLLMADTDLTPYDMGTFGSRTTPAMAPQLRRAAAAARESLVEMAAERLNVDRASLTAADGAVRGAGKSIGYGELTKGRKLIKTIPAAESVARPLGQSVPKVDGRDFVTGRHRYTADLTQPGMLHGKVLRAPAWNSTLASVDVSKAQAPGVTVVQEGEFIGVASPSAEQAASALGAIRAEWKTAPQPSGREIFAWLKSHAEGGPARPSAIDAPVKLSATYTVAYIAHAPLEPRAALASWQGDRLTVWTGTQRPFAVRTELANAFGIPEERVRVIVPDTGSGYGGKHTGEAAIEAARLAKAAGRPVKLVWTREEEFRWAYFRPAGVIEVACSARPDGIITAWEFHNYNSGPAGMRSPYDLANRVEEFHPVKSPLRQGSYRALAATANHFARESHMDELAHATKLDPLEFRLRNTKDPRLRAVLEAAAERFGWAGRKKTGDRGFGIAAGFEKGGYVATCVEASVARPSGAVTIHRVVEAFECGAVVNPRHLENQVQGAVVMGLGGALFEAVEFENGRMTNPRFSRYRVPRFSDAPPVEVVLLDRKDLPSAGAGETPIVGIAPALGNAIFDATGVRLRALPLAPKGVPAA